MLPIITIQYVFLKRMQRKTDYSSFLKKRVLNMFFVMSAK